MNHVGRVTQQRDPSTGVTFAQAHGQRKAGPRPHRHRFANPALCSLVQHVQELIVRQRQQRPGLSSRPRPDHRRAAIGQRQKRQRAAWKKSLPGHARVGWVCGDNANDALLIVFPDILADTQLPPQRRGRALRGHQQAGAEPPSVAQRYLDTFLDLME